MDEEVGHIHIDSPDSGSTKPEEPASPTETTQIHGIGKILELVVKHAMNQEFDEDNLKKPSEVL
ncbi:MAG: hypothetical protein M3P33_03480 [bacterium]|nr:hypothetical protein [bacterium]